MKTGNSELKEIKTRRLDGGWGKPEVKKKKEVMLN